MANTLSKDRYGCHFSQRIKIADLSSITPQGCPMTFKKRITFWTFLYKKATGHHFADEIFKLIFLYEDCYVSIIDSLWGHGKLFAICRWNFEINFCFSDNCCILIIYSTWTKWPPLFIRKCFENFVNSFSCMKITVFWCNLHWGWSTIIFFYQIHNGHHFAHVIFIAVFWLYKLALRLKQNGDHIADDNFRLIILVWVVVFW